MDFDVLHRINQWARDAGIIRIKTYAHIRDVICKRDELRRNTSARTIQYMRLQASTVFASISTKTNIRLLLYVQ